MKCFPIYKTVAVALALGCTSLCGFCQTTIIGYNTGWKYLDNNTRPANWEKLSFSDAGWATGNAELGYGDGDEATPVSFGGNASGKYITTYFRKTVSIANPAAYSNFTLNVERDDGVVLYVNGTEAGRNNMPTGTIAHGTLASSAVEDATVTFTLPASLFVAGNNTIAAEVHQSAANSSDLSFNLQLLGNAAGSVSLARGPFLQMGNETAITFRWRTGTAAPSKVEVGTAYGTYPVVVSSPAATTEHEVRVTGLLPDTKYYYRIGTATQVLQEGTDNFFTTAPPETPGRKVRIAVFGDCGRNDNSFQTQTLAQYRNYLAANSIDAADAWLLLGDNAYNSGTDAEYSANFFAAYGSTMLKNHKLFPAPGNHDYAGSSARQADHNIPYYQIFSLPTNAECGGVASGNEAYYSFDIGNVHFLSLDSYGKENGGVTRLYDTTGAQVTWIKNDLAANTRKWTVAYWHHAPYTMTSHNSDSETELVNIRNNFIRILERYGVDLILSGHSHSYERSYLLNGHYGNESSFNAAAHAVSTSSARYDGSAGSCPYLTASGQGNQGTVYVVAGSSGADGGVQTGYPHNAMPFSVDDGGMLYFEVDDNRLDARFLRRDGTIGDKFTIMQDITAARSYSVTSGQPVTLAASWQGNFSWSNGATTRSVTLTPPVGTSIYTVTDNASSACLTERHTVTVTAATTLPVRLVSYEARQMGTGVYLGWHTASELNNRYFTIERSTDAVHFNPLARVGTEGTSTAGRLYAYTDPGPVAGDNYYRLSQTDADNRITYLGVRKIIYRPVKRLQVKAIAAENAIQLQLSVADPAVAMVQVVDVMGRKVASETVSLHGGSLTKKIPVSSGTYVWMVRTGNNETVSQTIIVR